MGDAETRGRLLPIPQGRLRPREVLVDPAGDGRRRRSTGVERARSRRDSLIESSGAAVDRSSSAVEGPAWATPRAIVDSERTRSRAVSRGPRRADGLCAHAGFDVAMCDLAGLGVIVDHETRSQIDASSYLKEHQLAAVRHDGLDSRLHEAADDSCTHSIFGAK